MARHRQAVYRVARRLLGSHEEADEAAQVAFVRAWRSLDRFREESSLRTWLTRIVLNVAKSMRSARRPVDSAFEWERLPDPARPSDERLGRDEARRRVRLAVAGLPPRQRQAVVLKVFSEMTYREVAEAMELSEGTIKAHFHQAVSNLRRALGRSAKRESD